HAGGRQDARGIRRALRSEGDVGAPHARSRRRVGEGRGQARPESHHRWVWWRRSSRWRRGRAHHAPGARRADAFQTSAGARFAAFHRADAERHPGGDFCHRRGRRGQRRALRRRHARAVRQESGFQVDGIQSKTIRRGQKGRAAEAMKPEIRKAAEILRAGGLVAFPTETVYGLGADASNAGAVARLYATKRRPADHPVIVHFGSKEKAFSWAREVPTGARQLAERFWPGPLTLILKRSALARDFITGEIGRAHV